MEIFDEIQPDDIKYSEDIQFILDMKYGLIVIDPYNKFDENGNYLIHHFCGYTEQPEPTDADILAEELENDENFIVDDMEDLEIIEAPMEVVEHFRKQLLDEYAIKN